MMASEIHIPSRCHQLEFRHLLGTLFLLQYPDPRKQQPASGWWRSAPLLLSMVWISQQQQCPMQMPILQLRVAHWMASGFQMPPFPQNRFQLYGLSAWRDLGRGLAAEEIVKRIAVLSPSRPRLCGCPLAWKNNQVKLIAEPDTGTKIVMNRDLVQPIGLILNAVKAMVLGSTSSPKPASQEPPKCPPKSQSEIEI